MIALKQFNVWADATEPDVESDVKLHVSHMLWWHDSPISRPGLASLAMTSSMAALDCAQTRILNFGTGAGTLSGHALPLAEPSG